MDKKPNVTEVEIYLIAKVKELRIQRGISQSQLAHLLDAPIYKLELLELKRALIKLRSLESKILVSIKDDPNKFIVLTETDSLGETYRYKIILKEYLTAFRLLDGSWKLSNPECKFEKRKRVSDNVTEVLDRNIKLNRGFENIKHALNVVGNNSELFDIITSEGLVLRTYL
ncbi:hypothetical protein D7004_02640 [Pedobacter jejuensis]|uniref:HTH cro/C1-type domain-containing protein n=2 Tax=Pedobacter jejuensis TaxID=1268550 RepID=A0A3N0C1Q2_9SPHI|nr:hypothetical protein D7004_02640 [Pedobacter jejuensis]